MARLYINLVFYGLRCVYAEVSDLSSTLLRQGGDIYTFSA